LANRQTLAAFSGPVATILTAFSAGSRHTLTPCNALFRRRELPKTSTNAAENRSTLPGM
jgi:hypothetical protein